MSPASPAVRSGTGGSVVNGRWAVDPPGDYHAGGTTFTYTRPRAQGEGQEERGETLTAPGPTTTILQLYVRTLTHTHMLSLCDIPVCFCAPRTALVGLEDSFSLGYGQL